MVPCKQKSILSEFETFFSEMDHSRTTAMKTTRKTILRNEVRDRSHITKASLEKGYEKELVQSGLQRGSEMAKVWLT